MKGKSINICFASILYLALMVKCIAASDNNRMLMNRNDRNLAAKPFNKQKQIQDLLNDLLSSDEVKRYVREYRTTRDKKYKPQVKKLVVNVKKLLKQIQAETRKYYPKIKRQNAKLKKLNKRLA